MGCQSPFVRASNRLQELEALLTDISDSWEDWPTVTVASLDPYSHQIDSGAFLAEMNTKSERVQFDASHLASEVIHHIRSALEYCVNQSVLKHL